MNSVLFRLKSNKDSLRIHLNKLIHSSVTKVTELNLTKMMKSLTSLKVKIAKESKRDINLLSEKLTLCQCHKEEGLFLNLPTQF